MQNYFESGHTLLEQKKYIKAIKQFNLAVESDPEHAPAYFNRAVCWYKLKCYQRARQDFEAAHILGSDLAGFWC